MSLDWEARVKTSPWNHRGTIPSVRLHVRRESAGLVHLGQGGPDHPSRKRGGKEKQVTIRMEEHMKEERKAQWMASLQGLGWARRGRCHGL